MYTDTTRREMLVTYSNKYRMQVLLSIITNEAIDMLYKTAQYMLIVTVLAVKVHDTTVCLGCTTSDWSRSVAFTKFRRMILNASAEAYGMRVTGSKYFAGSPVMGHVDLPTERSLRRDGK